jgi:hypothetical protein
MDTIHYTSTAKIHQNNNAYTMHIRIYTIINKFMIHNPPCRKCLIQSMCIEENLSHPTLDSEPDHLDIKVCEKLKTFIDNSPRIKYRKRTNT